MTAHARIRRRLNIALVAALVLPLLVLPAERVCDPSWAYESRVFQAVSPMLIKSGKEHFAPIWTLVLSECVVLQSVIKEARGGIAVSTYWLAWFGYVGIVRAFGVYVHRRRVGRILRGIHEATKDDASLPG